MVYKKKLDIVNGLDIFYLHDPDEIICRDYRYLDFG